MKHLYLHTKDWGLNCKILNVKQQNVKVLLHAIFYQSSIDQVKTGILLFYINF